MPSMDDWWLDSIERALHFIVIRLDVSVDHGGLEIAMAQEALNGANVSARLQQVAGKAMTTMPSSA